MINPLEWALTYLSFPDHVRLIELWCEQGGWLEIGAGHTRPPRRAIAVGGEFFYIGEAGAHEGPVEKADIIGVAVKLCR